MHLEEQLFGLVLILSNVVPPLQVFSEVGSETIEESRKEIGRARNRTISLPAVLVARIERGGIHFT